MGGRKTFSIDLHEVPNPGCLGNCTKKDRQHTTEDDLCNETVSVIDGEKVRCVGSWAKKKSTLLAYYFSIFAPGMKNSSYPLNYVEICCGPGRCIYRDRKIEADGTSLAILHHQYFELVSNALFIDNNQTAVSIINKRIASLGLSHKAQAEIGDYYDESKIKDILEKLPSNSLNLVLVDPTDCSLPFKTLEMTKKTLNKTDLLINVPLYTDSRRNLHRAVQNNFEGVLKKYGLFLGDEKFLRSPEIMELSKSHNAHKKLADQFLERYITQLKKIGFRYCDSRKVTRGNLGLYRLLFASSHPRGLDFFKKTPESITDDDSQHLLRF